MEAAVESQGARPARRIGNVPVFSWRGLVAVLLYTVSAAVLFGSVLLAILGHFIPALASGEIHLTLRDLLLELAINVLVLLALPAAAIAITHPGERGAVVRRVRAEVGPRTPLYLAIGVLTTFAAILVLGLVLYALSQAGLYTPEESTLVPQIQALLTWPLVVIIALVAGVTEEFYFRGVLQPRLGILVSSLLFAAVHVGYGTPLQVAAPFVLGLVFGLLYQRTGSLWAPMAAHFSFDFVELARLMFGS